MRRPHLNRATIALVGSVLVVVLLALPASAAQLRGSGDTHSGSTRAQALGRSSEIPTINWALSGQATATTSQTGNPPANAVDGDAATSWCTDSWPDTLTVDLGQVRNLNGIGITLDNASSSASASVSVSTQVIGKSYRRPAISPSTRATPCTYPSPRQAVGAQMRNSRGRVRLCRLATPS
jgi:F5/8 type C domain